jgi:hypothetical protein
MKIPVRTLFTLAAMALTGLSPRAPAKEIPAQLPHPDGKPGDVTKPVKVYLLAGQSNMVGMGDISGARPPYPNLFLAADPALIPGVTPISPVSGGKAQGWVPVARHGVFEAKATVDAGPGDTTKQPKKTVAVALGTVSENLPATAGTQTVVVTALIEVPASGNYQVHAGFGESSHNVVLLDGREAYRKDIGGKPVITTVALVTGKRYPVTITYFKGGSAAFWLEQIGIEGKGDLVTLTKQDKKFPYLLDDAGKWTVRNDVIYTDPRLFPDRASSPLSPTSNNGKSIGPEVGFGCVMGTFHDEQVLLIKSAMGNRSLGFDFRPPSSGRTDAANNYEGLEYRLMIEGVHKTLDQIDKIVPGYQGQGYEVAGFGWFQGHKDSGASKEEYEKHLVNLINDLRKEFKAPKMPAVVATVGFHGYRIVEGPWKGIWEAQLAVGDPKQHPEFAGTVASVDTRDFWREREESPADQDYHYNRNPETYLLVGEAMGRAMVCMQGGEAVAIPKSADRESLTAARVAAEAAQAAKPAPTAAQKAASLAAIKPMILDCALPAFVSNPRYQPSLQAAIKGEKPAKVTPLLEDTLDEAADYYRAAGIADYDWKPFGGDLSVAAWDYFCFDLPDAQAKTKGISDLKLTCPAGIENWFAPDFDAKKAGWMSGVGPFGLAKDPITYPEWYGPSKRVPPTTVCEKDVVLLRRSFELPPLRDDHRYRIRVSGSIHANSGEGFAIYVNGKLLVESKAGVVAWRREGAKPRGGHIWADFRGEFKGGKVTIAVSNFPMNNKPADGFIPARAPLSVWLEEMKIPPVE